MRKKLKLNFFECNIKVFHNATEKPFCPNASIKNLEHPKNLSGIKRFFRILKCKKEMVLKELYDRVKRVVVHELSFHQAIFPIAFALARGTI